MKGYGELVKERFNLCNKMFETLENCVNAHGGKYFVHGKPIVAKAWSVEGEVITRFHIKAIVAYPDGAEVTGQWGGGGAIENIPLTMLYEWDIPHIIAEIADPK